MRAAVIGNESEPDAGHVGRRLVERGVTLHPWAREQHHCWPALSSVDLLVLLGSDWSVYWDHVDDAVRAEQALVRHAHHRGVPTLAICFGAQVVASALGGAVERAPEPEIGWYGIDSDHPCISSGPWMQWHSDRVLLPSGARELARSPLASQAFLIERTLAVQFHPEVTSDTVRRWTSGGGAQELAAAGVALEQLLADTDAFVRSSSTATDVLVDWFCEGVAGS